MSIRGIDGIVLTMSAYASDPPARVVIAGGGFAGLETLLALRVLSDRRVPVTLIAPESTFHYRPAATVEAFGEDPQHVYSLEEIADDLGAAFRCARLESVGTERRYVRLSTGERLPYDYLVLALGTRPRARIPGALTFRDRRDLPLLRSVLQGLDAGSRQRLVFGLPSPPAYAVPLYELALQSAAYTAAHGVAAEITVASHEAAPLAQFGEKASLLVAELLAERGVRFVGGSAPAEVRHDGALVLSDGTVIDADRVIAVPQLRGQPITGVPSNPAGFIPADAFGRVQGMPGVFAAGDITAFPIKQAALATQMGDSVAQRILENIGVPTPHIRRARVVQAQLIGGEHPLFLWAELDNHGRATSASLGHAAPGFGITREKVFARYLTPYLERIRERAGTTLTV